MRLLTIALLLSLAAPALAQGPKYLPPGMIGEKGLPQVGDSGPVYQIIVEKILSEDTSLVRIGWKVELKADSRYKLRYLKVFLNYPTADWSDMSIQTISKTFEVTGKKMHAGEELLELKPEPKPEPKP